jgi:HD-like signal output (HDOD) protein
VSTVPDTAAAVVRFANSSYVGALYPVGSVMDAVVRIGARQVGAIAMASLNKELVESWGTPELWEDTLTVARATKHIARLTGLDRSGGERAFVAGLFSASGAAALVARDPGYLAWRSRQWLRGVDENQLLRRERMVFEEDHVMASGRLLDEWNLPGEIAMAVAAHHDPRTALDLSLHAGLTVLAPRSVSRCSDRTFAPAMRRLGLSDHIGAVEVEAVRFAEAFRPDDDDVVVAVELSKGTFAGSAP